MHTLYATIGSGNCFKAHLVMNQLGISYRTELIDVLKGETRQPHYLAINPAGTVPFLRLSDGNTIAESNAMLWFLAAGSDLAPKSAYEQAMAVQWMIFEQTRLEPNISPARFFTSIVPARRDEMSDQIKDWQVKGNEGLKLLDQHLSNRDFVLGTDYSIADIAIYGYTHVANEGGFDLATYPGIMNWISRVASTPRYMAMNALPAAA
ncbi:MAG: glutathione S-transferase family protein [Pseudomonadota bacterium]